LSLIMQDPLFVPQLMAHVGPAALADWMLHVGGLAAFSTFNSAGVCVLLVAVTWGHALPLRPVR
jgi:hypothetical protein